MPAKLFRVTLPVPDMDRAVACYNRLFDSEGERIAPTRHYFHCGETIVALIDPSGHGGTFRASEDILYFAVPDLEAAQRRAQEAGCTEMDSDSLDGGGNQIAVRPWGERSFYSRDPFGNPLCFVHETTLFTGARG
ncbi:MAG: VOC family protein [Chloroflexi bacterium]|nr:VOC family protein [Chloroflexota bacterium]